MRAVLAFALLVALTTALATDVDTSPLLLWSNQDGIVGRGSGSHVLSNAEEATANIVIGLLGKGGHSTDLVNLHSAASHQGLSVVIFAGSQLSSSDLRQGKAFRLSDVLDSSASSLVLPFAESLSQNTASSLLKSLEEAGLAIKTVGCGQQAVADLATEVSSALASTSHSEAQVILVCPSVDRALSNTQAGLEQELDQLLAVQEVVDAAELKHVSVYLSQGGNQEALRRRRTLQAASPPTPVTRVVKEPLKGFGPYTTCGTLCQTQVRWLEALLSVLFMALAICSGLTCLNVLNTPTRFEVPTE